MPHPMSNDRIRVWIQSFKGRANLMLQWHDPATGDRKSKSAGTGDADVAEVKRQALEYELNAGILPDGPAIAWDRFRGVYERDKVAADGVWNRRKATSVLDRFESAMKPKTLGGIVESTLTGYANRLRTDGLADSTIKGHLTYLRVMLRWSLKQRLISRMPSFSMPKVSKGANRRRIRTASRITDAHFARLLECCPTPSWRLLASLCWYAGLRREEAHVLRGEHIDLARHVIELPSNKANDQAQVAFIVPELDAIIRQRFPEEMDAGPVVDPAELAMGLTNVSAEWTAKIAAVAKVPGNSRKGFCTLHDLRRAFGSRWAAKVPAQVLKGMMRHSSLQTTLDYYADTEAATIGLLWDTPKQAG